ncbi:hypothetical protein ABFX02_01G012000 [Erythranthe guttata]
MELSFLGALLIILVLVTSPVRTIAFSDTNARITDELINDICSKTKNPSLCLNSLKSLKGGRLFPKPLFVLGAGPMSMAQSHANKTAKVIWDHYHGKPFWKDEIRLRYNRCVVKYADAMKQLKEAKKFMLAGEAKSVKHYTLLAVDRVDSCDSELTKLPETNNKRKFLQDNKEFKDLCDIIVGICNKVYS